MDIDQVPEAMVGADIGDWKEMITNAIAEYDNDVKPTVTKLNYYKSLMEKERKRHTWYKQAASDHPTNAEFKREFNHANVALSSMFSFYVAKVKHLGENMITRHTALDAQAKKYNTFMAKNYKSSISTPNIIVKKDGVDFINKTLKNVLQIQLVDAPSQPAASAQPAPSAPPAQHVPDALAQFFAQAHAAHALRSNAVHFTDSENHQHTLTTAPDGTHEVSVNFGQVADFNHHGNGQFSFRDCNSGQYWGFNVNTHRDLQRVKHAIRGHLQHGGHVPSHTRLDKNCTFVITPMYVYW